MLALSFKEGVVMQRLIHGLWQLRFWKETRGQDLIEYALMAGFVAVAAGAVVPGISTSIGKIFTSVEAVLTGAGG
jgi:pilus assembly protein Flp/PilA